MAISRAQLAAELEPGLNALFGMEYDQYDQEYADIFSIEDSSKAFEEEVLIVGLIILRIVPGSGNSTGFLIPLDRQISHHSWIVP